MTSLRGLSLGLGLAAGLTLPAMAVPITIDFEPSASLGTISSGGVLLATLNGVVDVTFQGTGLQFVQFTNPPFIQNGADRVLATFPAVNSIDQSSPAITITLSGGRHFLSAKIHNLLHDPNTETGEIDRIVINAFKGGSLVSSITGTSEFLELTSIDADLIQLDDVPGANGAEPIGFTIAAFSFELVPVPEPMSMAALAVGLVALASRRRR